MDTLQHFLTLASGIVSLGSTLAAIVFYYKGTYQKATFWMAFAVYAQISYEL